MMPGLIFMFISFKGDQPEMPTGIPMTAPAPQSMGALQHETMMHQQLAALQQGAVAAQQNMGQEGMSPQRVPQPGMSPQQHQALAAHLHMQAQQGNVYNLLRFSETANSAQVNSYYEIHLSLLSIIIMTTANEP